MYDDEESSKKVVEMAQAYHHNPARRYFDARVKGHATWGVFNNEIGGH